MRGRKGRCLFLGLLFLLFLAIPSGDSKAASKVFDIVVKDGYSTQKIGMYYGKTPYGYQGYFAEKSVITVNPKSRKVTFSVKNTGSRYGNFHFQHSTLRPTDEPKANLFSYTDHGRTRAFFFTVKKVTASRMSRITVIDASGKSQKKYSLQGKKKVAIRCTITSDREPEIYVEIRNQKKQTVYKRKIKSALDKSLVLWWDGTASRKNEAGLKAGQKLAAGNYTIVVNATVKCGKKTFVTEKNKKIQLVKNLKTK